MNLKSIRWKLPLTYAGIALITALALGGTLLLIVRRYYQDQELNYLRKNAVAISDAVEPFFTTDPMTSVPDDLKVHLSLLSFLSQTKVQLFDPQGKEIGSFSFTGDKNPNAVLAAISLPQPEGAASSFSTQLDDLKASGAAGTLMTYTKNAGSSGMIGIQVYQAKLPPGEQTVPEGSGGGSISAVPQPNSTSSGSGPSSTIVSAQPDASSGSSSGGSISAIPEPLKIIAVNGQAPDALTTNKVFLSQIPVANTMYGVDLQGGVSLPVARSDQSYRQAIQSSTGAVLGSVELSDGPAYGLDIVLQVASTWIIASLVAVAIAIFAGLWISRRINAPILVLTNSTRRMAAGDLSARADIQASDEFGALATSFNTMAGQVEETVAALRRFVADAAHELQTPLTALRTNLELASTGNKPADQVAYLENAQAQVERLNHLVRELLDLSRLETGVQAGQPAPLDLVALARGVSEPYAARAEQAGIELAVQFPPDPVTVAASETQLQHALGNLLDNALKFTPQGGMVTLALSVEEGLACLRVSDTGIGIPPDDLPGLFERFHRGRNAAGYPGSGLGLAIVKAIAVANGGQVSAENLPAGASFVVKLPLMSGKDLTTETQRPQR